MGEIETTIKAFVCTIEDYHGNKNDCRVFANTATQAREKLIQQFPKHYVSPAVTLKEYMNKNKWISVKDRLPESDGFYLAWYTFKDGGHARDIFYYNCGSPISSTITHWMLLPEPPKSEDDTE